jgi:hypothetical protein
MGKLFQAAPQAKPVKPVTLSRTPKRRLPGDTVGAFQARCAQALRMALQPLVKFRQFADVKDAAMQGKGKGDVFHWNVYSDVATAGTVLTETSTMPETNFVITQGTMTITEGDGA